MIAACHEQLINKMHTVQGMDDIDAKFKRVLDVSVSDNVTQYVTK